LLPAEEAFIDWTSCAIDSRQDLLLVVSCRRAGGFTWLVIDFKGREQSSVDAISSFDLHTTFATNSDRSGTARAAGFTTCGSSCHCSTYTGAACGGSSKRSGRTCQSSPVFGGGLDCEDGFSEG
jgi:hypothetical protein